MENPARSFQDLVVWQKAHQFVLGVYRFTRDFSSDERFGLTLQLRRAAVSVPANIAEGFPKRSSSDKVRYFNIAQGSLEESHYYLILAQDLGYGSSNELLKQYNEVARLLNAYVAKIRSSNS